MITKSRLITVFILLIFQGSGMAQFVFSELPNRDVPNQIIGEFGVSWQQSTFQENDKSYGVSLNVGYQRIINERYTLGGHLFTYSLSEKNLQLMNGLRTRISFLPTEKIELALSPGLILHSTMDEIETPNSYSMETHISYDNMLSLAMRVDSYKIMNGERETVVNLGLKAHGEKSFFGGGAVLLLIGILSLIPFGI